MQDIDQPRFDQLRLRQRRDDTKNRFAWEKRCALGYGMNLAAEAESGKIIEEVFIESTGALEPIDVGGREAKLVQKIQRLRQPGGEQESAPRRQAAHEQFEHRRVGVAMIQIGLNHVDLIKVGQQRTGCGFQCGNPF